jgi:predicted  nucleic acid-binding Zn-ribbon protein
VFATPAVYTATRVAAALAPMAAAASAARFAHDEHQPDALVREGQDGMMLSGDLADMKEIDTTRAHLRGDFLWFRRDGVGYVVQDPALLARARGAWAQADEVGKKMEAISEQMKPHSQRMEALGKQMEAHAARGEPYARQMEALGRKMEPLARQQQELGEKMRRLSETRAGLEDEAAMQKLQSQMDGLSAQMQVLSRAMEEKGALMQQAHEPMEALGKQMEAAGKPMEELGRRMEPLGKQMEVLSKQADAEVQQLIDGALREGKAVPARNVAK